MVDIILSWVRMIHAMMDGEGNNDDLVQHSFRFKKILPNLADQLMRGIANALLDILASSYPQHASLSLISVKLDSVCEDSTPGVSNAGRTVCRSGDATPFRSAGTTGYCIGSKGFPRRPWCDIILKREIDFMADTSIEWTDVTWNPVAGCTVLSPGCTNCYAMRMAARLEAMGSPKYQGLTRQTGGRAKWNGIVRIDEATLVAPLHWNKPRMVFVNSMSDLFHAGVPEEFIARVWDVMARASEHTFQILTKRPERMANVVQHLRVLPNVWLGTSVESANYLGRLDDLRRARAHVRFVSFEPLLSSVGQPDLNSVSWAIVGGESGPQARLMNRNWVEDIHVACRKHNTAFFFKQWGGRNKKATGRVLYGKTWDEFPISFGQAKTPQFPMQV